jgi:hypothetical protein
LSRRDRSFEPRLSFTNTDLGLLEWANGTLEAMGLRSYVGLPDPQGARQVQMWRVVEILQLMRILPFRHSEKKAKVRLLLDSRKARSEVKTEWSELSTELEHERVDFIELAADELKRKYPATR